MFRAGKDENGASVAQSHGQSMAINLPGWIRTSRASLDPDPADAVAQHCNLGGSGHALRSISAVSSRRAWMTGYSAATVTSASATVTPVRNGAASTPHWIEMP